MPDNAAALARAFTLKQTLYRQFYRPELLVTADNLDRLPLVVGGKQGEGANDIAFCGTYVKI